MQPIASGTYGMWEHVAIIVLSLQFEIQLVERWNDIFQTGQFEKSVINEQINKRGGMWGCFSNIKHEELCLWRVSTPLDETVKCMYVALYPTTLLFCNARQLFFFSIYWTSSVGLRKMWLLWTLFQCQTSTHFRHFLFLLCFYRHCSPMFPEGGQHDFCTETAMCEGMQCN